jgi:hypothetical protein
MRQGVDLRGPSDKRAAGTQSARFLPGSGCVFAQNIGTQSFGLNWVFMVKVPGVGMAYPPRTFHDA